MALELAAHEQVLDDVRAGRSRGDLVEPDGVGAEPVDVARLERRGGRVGQEVRTVGGVLERRCKGLQRLVGAAEPPQVVAKLRQGLLLKAAAQMDSHTRVAERSIEG